MNLFGPLLGLAALLLLGLGFAVVILGERYLGADWWPYLVLTGSLLIGLSLAAAADAVAALLGVMGAVLIWGAAEMKDQARRVALGWFPAHPRKLRPPWLRRRPASR